jgi:hypothetical protein
MGSIAMMGGSPYMFPAISGGGDSMLLSLYLCMCSVPFHCAGVLFATGPRSDSALAADALPPVPAPAHAPTMQGRLSILTFALTGSWAERDVAIVGSQLQCFTPGGVSSAGIGGGQTRAHGCVQSRASPISVLRLRSVSIWRGASSACVFGVGDSGRPLVFRASSDSEATAWTDALQQAVAFYSEAAGQVPVVAARCGSCC